MHGLVRFEVTIKREFQPSIFKLANLEKNVEHNENV